MSNWKKSLITKTPEEGFERAIELAQEGVKKVQPNEKIREKIRPKYSKNADSIIFASQVIAIHYQTIAQANNYWKSKQSHPR